ncbi:MAG: hypothetical protein ACI4PT_01580, partial [Candidatus Avoscillospira sp.]
TGKIKPDRPDKLEFDEVRDWRGSAPKAFPLRGRWPPEGRSDEVEKGHVFAGSSCKMKHFPAHLISLTSFGSFPSRGSLGRSRASALTSSNPNFSSLCIKGKPQQKAPYYINTQNP